MPSRRREGYDTLPIGSPDFALRLREAFDITESFSVDLATTIVPVVSIPLSASAEAGGVIPWSAGFAVLGSAAGTLAHWAVRNDRDDQLVTLDRIVAVTGGGLFRGGVLGVDIAVDVDDIRALQAVNTADLAGGSARVAVEMGRVDDNVATVAIKDALPNYFTHFASLMQERFPRAVLSQGQAFYCMGNGIIGGDSFLHVLLEGTVRVL